MNERQTADDAIKEDELRQRAMPRKNEAAEGRSETAGDGKMSTADLAYGGNKGRNDGAPRAETSQDEHVSLIEEGDAGGYRERWTSIQTKFIDEPRETVGEADELVADVIQSLASRFAEERQSLETQWQSGTEVSTEDLRLAMQHYRSFFERLLAA